MRKKAVAFIVILSLGFLCAWGAKGAMRFFYPQKFEDSVTRYSVEYQVPQALIYAVIRTESSFRINAQSEVGAMGLMQIMPDTLDWLCHRMGEDVDSVDIHDPDTAIRFGTYLLRYLLDEFGDTHTALAAYHAGIGRVHEWLNNETYSPDGVSLQTIPYTDTAHYVAKVERARQTYKNLYNDHTN